MLLKSSSVSSFPLENLEVAGFASTENSVMRKVYLPSVTAQTAHCSDSPARRAAP